MPAMLVVNAGFSRLIPGQRRKRCEWRYVRLVFPGLDWESLTRDDVRGNHAAPKSADGWRLEGFAPVTIDADTCTVCGVSRFDKRCNRPSLRAAECPFYPTEKPRD